MADKHEEAARKKALAAKYADIARKREEKLKDSLSNAQYDFFRNHGQSVDQTIYSNLVTAMRDPSTVPSEYVSKKWGWLFDLAIPSREKDAILYFADRLQEYPYSDSYGRRLFRAKGNGAYASKLAYIIRQYGSSYMNDHGKQYTSMFTNKPIHPKPSKDFHKLKEHTDCFYMLDRMKNDRYDCIRNDPHFVAIILALEEYAK